MIRLFVAIAVPAETAETLAPLAEGLRGAAWSRPENLHITLRFVGGAPESVADDLDAALGAIRPAGFDVSLVSVGSFDDRGEIRAIWAGVEASPPLDRLRRRCETAARQAGLTPDTRAWKPHVTLAYLRGASQAQVAAWTQRHSLLRAPPFTVTRFGLYSSWPSRDGAVYRLERTYPLKP